MTHANRRAILGLFLIFIGVLFLLNNLDLLPRLPWWVFTWEMLLITIGLFNLITGNRTPAIILIGIGSFFLIKDAFYWNWRDYWPVILIIIGVAFIFRQKKTMNSNVLNENFFDALNIFGGGNQRIVSQKLEGGKVTCIFGGCEVDLRESRPVAGASIEVFTLFGGTELIVPSDWNVKIEVTSILGGFADKRKTTQASEHSPMVTIRGMTLLGGGEIKS
ncbi:MAG: cell wall-active antibiotics response protein [Cyclobacteriaceae bacterium]|nr:cell wall-active antibiotics response protein [Cyclobacteriaceae bacterium]